MYYTNTKTDELQSLLTFFDINQSKRIIFAGDFKIFFTSKLEARCGKSISKRKSIIKLVGIKESLDVCDIWELEILCVKILHLEKTVSLDL